MADLTAARLIGLSGPGYYTKNIPANGAIANLKRGATIVTNAAGKAIRQAGASGVFAGFAKENGTYAVDELVPIEIADRVVLPFSTAAVTHIGDFAESDTDDETYDRKAAGAGGVTAAVATNASRLGLIVDVEVGVSITVDTRLRG